VVRGLSSVCLSHSCTLLKAFDGFRCHLAGPPVPVVGSNHTLCQMGVHNPLGEGRCWGLNPSQNFQFSIYDSQCKNVKVCVAFYGNPSQSYGASPAIRDHIVFPATRHRRARPALTLTIQTGTRVTYAGRMEG